MDFRQLAMQSVRESEADLNIRRLSLQNLLLSYQSLLVIGLAAEAKGESA
jgi:hypothetical protein